MNVKEIHKLIESYNKKYKNISFTNRYINVSIFHDYLKKNYSDYITQIGTSFLGKPIYKLSIGTGEIKLLMWTQMHGNESTGTLAALDLAKYLFTDGCSMLSKIQLDIILMLNPDGAEVWQRRTAIQVDMNRDFIAEQTIEMRLLKQQFSCENYNLCLNIHDQRSIFNVATTAYPATLSFLAPSIDESKTLTENRKKSMGIIQAMVNDLNYLIPNNIARFSDEYYPLSTGDNFQKSVPTILFEAGHFSEDYNRTEVRKYMWFSLISLLEYITNISEWEKDYKLYEKILENKSMFYDLILRDVTIVNNEKSYSTDIAIQYDEIVKGDKQKLIFVPKIIEMGDLRYMYAHSTVDTNGKIYKNEPVLSLGDDATQLLEIYNCKFFE